MELNNIQKAIQEGLKLKEEKDRLASLEKERLSKIEAEKQLELEHKVKTDAVNKIHNQLPSLIKDAIIADQKVVEIYVGFSNMQKDQENYYKLYEEFMKDELKKFKLTFFSSSKTETEIISEDPYHEAKYHSYWLNINIPFNIE